MICKGASQNKFKYLTIRVNNPLRESFCINNFGFVKYYGDQLRPFNRKIVTIENKEVDKLAS